MSTLLGRLVVRSLAVIGGCAIIFELVNALSS